MAGNTHGAITGLSDDFLNTSRNVLDMDMRRRYFQNYAPEGLSFDDFNKAIDSKLYGRGGNAQGSGSFSKLVEAEKMYRTTGSNLPSTNVVNDPNWRYFQTSKSTSIVPTGDITGTVGSGYRYTGEIPAPEQTSRPSNDLSAQKKYEIDRAMGKRGQKSDVSYEKGTGSINEGEVLKIDKGGTAAKQGSMYDRLRNIENANIKEDVNFLSKMTKDKILSTINNIERGITNTKEAQAILRTMNSPEGQTILKGLKLGGKALGTLGRVGLKIAGPVGWGLTAKDMIDLGVATFNYNKAKKYENETNKIFTDFKNLKAQGYNERTAWQMVNGLPADNQQQVSQQPIQTQATNKKVDMKQKIKNEIANDTQNLPQAGGNMEQFINNQIAKYGGYDGGGMNNMPPVSVPADGGQPIQPVIASTQQEQPVQPIVQNTQPPQQVDYAQQIMQMTPEGYVSAQDIMDKLNVAYANINQQIGADPRYQGGVVQANNPYNIDEKELARRQRFDEYMNAFGIESNMGEQYAKNRQVMYEQQMANQLGVPYSDYIDATLDQRKARIANEAQQIESALKLQAQQATDMKTRLEAMNKMQQLRNDVATEMYKAELDAQTKKDVAMLNAVGGIAKTQAFTNAPSTMMQAAGQYAGNVGGVLGGNYMYSNLWQMTPEQRGLFMNIGRPVSDEELQVFFGRMGNVPAQFRAQGGQMPVQQAQQQGILPNIAQWVMGN